MIVASSSIREIMNTMVTQTKRFEFSSVRLRFCTIAIIAVGIIFSLSVALEKGILNTYQNVFAQSDQQESDAIKSLDRVTINVDTVKFAPLTSTNINQLKVDINYQTNDPTLVNTIMSGVMKVYSTDGILIKTSTIPKGYVLGQAGPMHFATSFEDETIQDVKAEIAMTDTLHAEKISNTLSVSASLEK